MKKSAKIKYDQLHDADLIGEEFSQFAAAFGDEAVFTSVEEAAKALQKHKYLYKFCARALLTKRQTKRYYNKRGLTIDKQKAQLAVSKSMYEADTCHQKLTRDYALLHLLRSHQHYISALIVNCVVSVEQRESDYSSVRSQALKDLEIGMHKAQERVIHSLHSAKIFKDKEVSNFKEQLKVDVDKETVVYNSDVEEVLNKYRADTVKPEKTYSDEVTAIISESGVSLAQAFAEALFED